jgi:hypothetical protein
MARFLEVRHAAVSASGARVLLGMEPSSEFAVELMVAMSDLG